MKDKNQKLIPVVVIDELTTVEEKMQALLDGGVDIAEITLRTDCALQAIALASEKFTNMKIGAGTVIDAEQCRSAIKAGAQFIVSPGLSKGVAKVCQQHGVEYYPGCVTPTEIMLALDMGITIVKFFPCNVYGGLKALRALSAPFPQIKFIPTGGVDNSNLAEYLSFDKVFAVGGSYMFKGDIVAECKKSMQIIKETR